MILHERNFFHTYYVIFFILFSSLSSQWLKKKTLSISFHPWKMKAEQGKNWTNSISSLSLLFYVIQKYFLPLVLFPPTSKQLNILKRIFFLLFFVTFKKKKNIAIPIGERKTHTFSYSFFSVLFLAWVLVTQSSRNVEK